MADNVLRGRPPRLLSSPLMPLPPEGNIFQGIAVSTFNGYKEEEQVLFEQDISRVTYANTPKRLFYLFLYSKESCSVCDGTVSLSKNNISSELPSAMPNAMNTNVDR